MTLTIENLKDLKKNLLNEKERIENEINLITKPSFSGDRAVLFDELGSSEDENASEMDEYADNLAIDNTLKKQLGEIIEALEKISQGNYGKCEKCGNEIQIERLKAYPSAKKCLNC
jgi:RNA polymerase-binding transcription factor DksA